MAGTRACCLPVQLRLCAKGLSELAVGTQTVLLPWLTASDPASPRPQTLPLHGPVWCKFATTLRLSQVPTERAREPGGLCGGVAVAAPGGRQGWKPRGVAGGWDTFYALNQHGPSRAAQKITARTTQKVSGNRRMCPFPLVPIFTLMALNTALNS